MLAGGGFAKAGIQKGDSLLAFNGKPLASWNEFQHEMNVLKAKAELEKKTSAEFSLVYSRAGVRDTVNVQTDSNFKVAAIGSIPDYKVTEVDYGFFQSFPAGVTLGINTLKGYVNDMKYVFTAEGAKSLGGFGTIGSIFPKVWDWQRFWEMTAFLSIILAVMNLLPIPALDGGHVLFLLLRNHRAPQAERQVPGICAGGGNVPAVRPAHLGKLQRCDEVLVLTNLRNAIRGCRERFSAASFFEGGYDGISGKESCHFYLLTGVKRLVCLRLLCGQRLVFTENPYFCR